MLRNWQTRMVILAGLGRTPPLLPLDIEVANNMKLLRLQDEFCGRLAVGHGTPQSQLFRSYLPTDGYGFRGKVMALLGSNSLVTSSAVLSRSLSGLHRIPGRTMMLNGTLWHCSLTRRFLTRLSPKSLLERIVHIATNPGDLVVDIFGGSGTSAAVAHKMRRRWVIAERNVQTVIDFLLPRLQRVMHGTDPGGITETTSWLGGGSFEVVHVPPRFGTPFRRDMLRVIERSLSKSYSSGKDIQSRLIAS